jgi:hypothetical protein
VTEEPADFEWRNLKKLIVLVLSSLVWKSPIVQNQIRAYGGVETIMSCTQYDGTHPATQSEKQARKKLPPLSQRLPPFMYMSHPRWNSAPRDPTPS